MRAMLETAKAVLGYDLLKLCLEGPKAALDDTACAQPALYVAGLAAIEKLRRDDPAAVNACSAAAGLSLGEYCALVFAGALSFEDGLKAWALPAPCSCHNPLSACNAVVVTGDGQLSSSHSAGLGC